MRVVIQRVSEAAVIINQSEYSSIGSGLLILLGIETSDSVDEIGKLVAKITKLRIFNDENEVMNRSVMDVDGEILVVSQFTLHADVKKGNRPSYIRAARPEAAIPLYEKFIALLAAETGKKIKTGLFGADMKVKLVNDGPVTILIDTDQL